MPYSVKEKKLYANLVKEYGEKKAQQVYHAMLNSGKYDKIFSKRSLLKRKAKESLKGW